MDSLTYSYVSGTNRLDHVDDVINTANYSDDIDDQASGNYTYDQIGNLTGDVAEEIQTIDWTVYGKVQRITRTSGSTKADIEFNYTPDGHRAMKKMIPKTGATEYTYYSRDAQGNELATYLVRNDSMWLEEVSVYGSSRLGTQRIHQFLNNQVVADTHFIAVTRGQKRYELSNHLGNVLAVVNDKHKNTCTTTVKYFPEVMQAYDYSPFGAILPNRLFALETRTVTKPGLLFKYNNDFNDGTTQGYVANGGAVKNVSNELYAYVTSGTSAGIRRDYSGLTVGTTYTITFTVDDSIGTNSYSVYLMKQPGSVVLANPIVSRGTYSYSFTVPTGTSVVQFIINSSNSSTFPLPAHNFYVDNVTMTYDGMVTTQEYVDNYRFGFNGQEKDNEVAGTGNSNTAQFWQYDPRLGRRWNIDPKSNPSISSYVAFANNPLFFGDPLGDTIRVGTSITSNKLLSTAFNLYAKTKEGRAFLSQYAAKGQTIGGYTFKEEGKLNAKGLDINFGAVELDENTRGETDYRIDENGRGQIDITINSTFTEKTVKGLVAETMGKTVTLFHETFIHGDLYAKDFLDNKRFDNSNISREVKTKTGGITVHYHHLQVLLDYEREGYNSTNLWPRNAFYGIKELNDKLKIYKDDQGIIDKAFISLAPVA